jgi:murein DD-endopeptidase MepM/ murein hydrolase activator NlpD
MRLGALFLVLVGVNVYVFFFRSGTSIRDVLSTGAIKGPALAGKKVPSKSSLPKQQPDDAIVVRGSMKKHIGLFSALAEAKVSAAETAKIVEALRPHMNMRSLRPSHTFEVRLDPETREVRQFAYRLSPVLSMVVKRTASGGFKTSRAEVGLDTKRAKIGGRIRSSLNRAITRHGETSALVAKFTDLFSWDVNWYADPREDDEFRIVVEKKYLKGKFYRYGKILAAEYRGKVGRYRAFFFRDGKEGGHYTAQGRSVRRDFLKMPLNFRRISSRYNRHRFHPVLHRTKGHFGVDYAAPRGTPIWAAADGKVVAARRAGGAGNMVKLQHKNGITTLYMHLQRFARGLKPGVRVRQRQVIGTVGSTGLATGPHLHYGIKVRGRHIDPLRFKVGKGPMLPLSARKRFFDQLEERVAELESIPAS